MRFCKMVCFCNFSPITIPEAACIGYELGTKCMVPLIKCMDNEQKEKLDVVFKKDFERLNLLLSNNGFPTCEAFGKTSFKTSKGHGQLLGTPLYDDRNTEKRDPILKLVSRPILNKDNYFLPTQPPTKGVKLRVRTLNRRNNQTTRKNYLKILI